MDILIEEFEGSLWAAALENGRLEGLELDPVDEEVRWGSIYWAKIKSFDAALDAAYLDLDGDNTGILFNRDTRLQTADGKTVKGGDKAITKTFKAGDMIAVQAKTAYIAKPGHFDATFESKLPTMSMDITLQGRHIIYCPLVLENRISRRIHDKKLRTQMHKMLEAMDSMTGIILRAAAADTQTDILKRESNILKEAWNQMKTHLAGNEPGLIMIGPDAVQRILSDQASSLIDRIEVVTLDHYKQAEEWCSIFAPDLVTKIEPIEIPGATMDFALFDHRDIMGQIEDLFSSYTLLPRGSSLIIQNTAALTAIDVNRGGDKRSSLELNREAAREAARQIRLRNIGGIILIDFINMAQKKDEKDVIQELERAVLNDPCTVQIHGFTALGLLEISRKRRTPPLNERVDSAVF